MALLDRFFGNHDEYDDDEESYLNNDEDDEEGDDDDEEDDDDNPTGFGDDDDNPDGYGGTPEVDPNASPFGDEDEEDENRDDDGEGSSDEKDKKNKKKKKKGEETDKDNGKTKVKGKVKKPSSKAAMKKNAISYGCLPTAEGYCPFCKEYSMFKSMRFGDKVLVEGPVALIAKQKISTFYCMNKACKKNWKSGWCVRCAGERYFGKKLPMKRILNKD